MKTKKDRQSLKFSRQVAGIFLKISWINRKRPLESIKWIGRFSDQVKAHKQRKRMEKQGVCVPPVMIFSVTNRCNLSCSGCYASAQKRNCKAELSTKRYTELFREASDMGTGIIIMAGGEPLLRKDLLEKAGSFKNLLFPVFTNGTLMQNGYIDIFSRYRNLVPVLSIEGGSSATDSRRGQGTYRKVEEAASCLKRNGVMHGLSITLTSENFVEVMSPGFINRYYENGSSLFFFVEYVPTGINDRQLCLKPEQKKRIQSRIINLRLVFPSVFLSLPGDESKFGGCLAAGRGFIHVSSNGDLEACPFAPYSDINILQTTLADGLRSGFLETIRNNHSMLKEGEGGCTLWSNRQWVETRLKQPKPARKMDVAGIQLTEAS